MKPSHVESGSVIQKPSGFTHILLKGLILAQNERWRRGLGMQVERETCFRMSGQRRKGEERVEMYPGARNSGEKFPVMPNNVFGPKVYHLGSSLRSISLLVR